MLYKLPVSSKMCGCVRGELSVESLVSLDRRRQIVCRELQSGDLDLVVVRRSLEEFSSQLVVRRRDLVLELVVVMEPAHTLSQVHHTVSTQFKAH